MADVILYLPMYTNLTMYNLSRFTNDASRAVLKPSMRPSPTLSNIFYLPSSMNNVVIKAENIGKKYLIGHQAERGGYTALRDVLIQNARVLRYFPSRP